MKVTIGATPAGTVGSLEKEKPYLQLADLSQDVDSIKEYFGNRPAVERFDGFLVNVEDGDYTEVYGFEGNIAYVHKPVFKITRTFSEGKPRRSRKYSDRKPRRPASTTLGGMR